MAIEDKITIDIAEELRKEFQEKMRAEAKERGEKTFPVFIFNTQSLAGKYILFLEHKYFNRLKAIHDQLEKEKKNDPA